MCIAIHKPAGIVLDRAIYQSCFDANPDGAGFAAVTPSGLIIRKGYFELDALLSDMEPHKDQNLLVHFRIATHGTVDAFNCHPWPIDTPSGRGFAVIHNGIIRSCGSSKEKSDTGHFVDEILTPLLSADPDILDNPAIIALLERDVTFSNKLVILRDDGKVWFLNGDEGIDDLGCWFSNQSYANSSFDADPRSSRRGAGADDEVMSDEQWKKWVDRYKMGRTEPESLSYPSKSNGLRPEDGCEEAAGCNSWLCSFWPNSTSDQRVELMRLVNKFWLGIGPEDDAPSWPEDRLTSLLNALPELHADVNVGDKSDELCEMLVDGGDALIDFLIGEENWSPTVSSDYWRNS